MNPESDAAISRVLSEWWEMAAPDNFPVLSAMAGFSFQPLEKSCGTGREMRF
jgi:hypothetical protein